MPQKASEPKPKKQKFSSFRYKTALKYLNIENLIDWTIDAPPTPATPFFKQRLDRLEQCFDLQSYSLQDLDRILSTLHHVFHCCQENLAKKPI